MALISGLQTSMSGMKTAQAQLDLIGRNVANVDTPGYTRKLASQRSIVLAGNTAGVKLGDIYRNVDQGLLKSFLASNSVSNNMSAQYNYLSKTETLLGSPQGDNSLASNVANLQKAMDTFSTDVASSAGRYNLINNASTLTSRLNSVSQEIQKLRGDADMDIKAAVDEINDLLTEIADVNNRIVKYNVLGYEGAADLMDQRDTALRELSGKIDISYFTRDTGELVIQTTGGVTLLDRDPHLLSHSPVAQASPTSSYASGAIGGIFVDGKDVTNVIRDGEMKGLIEIRDVTLPSLQSQLDEIAGVLKNSINEAHNRGTSFPASTSSLTGTRDFIDTAHQNIKIENGDVRFTIFDSDGKEFATTSLGGDLGFTQGSLDDMVTAVNNWLRSPTGANLPQGSASFDANGNLKIDTGDSTYSVSIVDEANSTPGGVQQDVKISFDSNGDGSYDRSSNGYSNFFGLNDFFVSNTNEAIYSSKVLSPGINLGLNDIVTLGFSDTQNGLNFASIQIYPNDSVQDIVNKINNDPTLSKQMTAALVPNGNGYELQIVNTNGAQLEIAENVAPGGTSSGLMNKLGLAPSDTGMAGSISVRQELVVNPNLISAGSPEFNKSTGEYQLNSASNNIANQLAKVFSETQDFSEAGSIASTKTSLANYASTFVGNIAASTNNAKTTLAYQSELTNSIATKEAKVSGVDMDEELAQMIMYQQTYAACAKSMTASKEILDMLLGMI